MIVNYDEEMRKALESMKDAPYDYFETGCSFCGEAVEWALKTIDSQRTEIERLQKRIDSFYTCETCVFYNGCDSVNGIGCSDYVPKKGDGE